MTHALQETIEWNDIVCGGTAYGNRFKDVWGRQWGVGKHAGASDIRSLVGQQVWNQYFTFSLVRHPVDRMKSMYLWTERIVERHGLEGWRRWARFFLKRYQNDVWEWPTVQVYLETDSFAEYVRHPDLEKALIATPQVDFLTSENSKGDLIVDRIFKLGKVNDRIDELCSRIGEDVTLPQNNVSNESQSVVVREAENRQIEDMYGDDFSVLDYQRKTAASTR